MRGEDIPARVSMWIDCAPERVFDAFVQPEALTCFWLSAADAPLEVGRAVHWSFLVRGAEVDATATRMERPHALEWAWSETRACAWHWSGRWWHGGDHRE